ncbi:MAG TPA: hypothetical protein VF618_26120 [Thermoanaerobaculia bacterium]
MHEIQQRDVLELAPGLWELRLRSATLWAAPVSVRAEAGAPAVTIVAYPTAPARGTADVTGAEPLDALTMRFSGADDGQTPSGDVPCTVEGQSWLCRVPVGVHDLSLRRPGYAPVHRWATVVAAGKGVNLGRIRFTKGGSVTGAVAVERPAKLKLNETSIEFRPASVGLTPTAQSDRNAVRSTTVRPDKRGRFHAVLTAGRYAVRGVAGDLVSTTREILVIDGREAQLSEPLMLAKPKTLTVDVIPARDPRKSPWTIALGRVNRYGVVESEITATVPETGRWVRAGLQPGSYQLTIRKTESDSWYRADLEIAEDLTHEARIPLNVVDGIVLLADQPIAATLKFETEHTGIYVKTRDDGSFRALMPAPPNGTWSAVTVEADNPQINRTLHDVPLIPETAESIPRVEIKLDGKTLRGAVVDDSGRPQPYSIVQLDSSHGIIELRSDSGVIEAAGLLPGTYLARAFTRHGETASPTEIIIEDATDPAPVELVVEESSQVRLTLQTESGSPTGAAVGVLPPDPRGYTFSPLPAQPDGTFQTRMPPKIQEAFASIHAPGYAWQLRRVPVGRDEVVQLSATSGELRLHVPAVLRDDQVAFLLHRRAAFPVMHLPLFAGAAASKTDEGIEFVIHAAEQGDYALCWLTLGEVEAATNGALRERCVSAFLGAGGTATLREGMKN